jgi:hypothetical protein
MLFRTQGPDVIAISQPMHAWVAGQLLKAWNEALAEPVLLAAEQHDLGWLDWEVAPSFDETTGRPHLFRDIGASVHAPMWAAAVDRAQGAWGAHVALLISRHGGVIIDASRLGIGSPKPTATPRGTIWRLRLPKSGPGQGRSVSRRTAWPGTLRSSPASIRCRSRCAVS